MFSYPLDELGVDYLTLTNFQTQEMFYWLKSVIKNRLPEMFDGSISTWEWSTCTNEEDLY